MVSKCQKWAIINKTQHACIVTPEQFGDEYKLLIFNILSSHESLSVNKIINIDEGISCILKKYSKKKAKIVDFALMTIERLPQDPKELYVVVDFE